MEILNEYGFLVDTAENGAEAVEKVKNSTPGSYDLVLMDVQMPVMNGYEATKQIRALDDPALAGITILAMTANAFDEDRKKALESGMAWKFIWMRVCVSLRRFIRQQEMTIVRLDYLWMN